MIEEQYVSFDTAKMLKEAGFDEVCSLSYCSDKGDKSFLLERNSDLTPGQCSCPTQALAARWLREAHNIHVFAFFDYVERNWIYCIADLDADTAEGGMEMSKSNYPTYEEAMEDALQEAIKLIKK